MTPPVPPIVAIVGATAAGKTGLSLDVAQALGGEVVNTDAMQVYRGMDVGTAKLAVAERRGIPHHLLDLLEVTEPLTVAEFQGWARDVIAELRRRGRTPVLVGGSALYTRAVLDRFEFPGTDPAVRARLESELAERGVDVLYARLSDQDPEAAERIRPDNGRRIVRALEVIEITGRPFTASLPELVYRDPHTVQLGVDLDRPRLHERIEQRVRQMFDAGLIEEVARLREAGLERGRTASGAIGYPQALALLDGEIDREEAIRRTAAATRQFARRQDSWFRKDPRIHWLPADDPDLLGRALQVLRGLEHPGGASPGQPRHAGPANGFEPPSDVGESPA